MKMTAISRLLLKTTIILLAAWVVTAGPRSVFAGCVTDGAVTKVADVPTAFVGDTVIYTITVFDDNECDVIDIDLTDTIPPEMTFVALGGTDAGECNDLAAPDITCAFVDVDGGVPEVRTFTIEVTVNGGEGTTVTNTADITPSGTNEDPGNDSASADVQILAATPSPVPTPTVPPTPVPPGGVPELEGSGCSLHLGAQASLFSFYGMGSAMLAAFWVLRNKTQR